jgi:hypothetical protein
MSVPAVQLDLLAAAVPSYRAGTYPGSRKPATSRDAAAMVAPKRVTREQAVLDALAVLGTATPDEIAGYLHLDATSVRPRTTMLANRGEIVPTGETRPTPMGGHATVYRLSDRSVDQRAIISTAPSQQHRINGTRHSVIHSATAANISASLVDSGSRSCQPRRVR